MIVVGYDVGTKHECSVITWISKNGHMYILDILYNEIKETEMSCGKKADFENTYGYGYANYSPEETKKHKHYDLIVAWANGEKIEYYEPSRDKWSSCSNPSWIENNTYRVKPKNIVKEIDAFLTYGHSLDFIENGYNRPNLSLTFDAETKELKGVELL